MSAEGHAIAMRARLNRDGGSQVEDGQDTPLYTQEKCADWLVVCIAAGFFAALALVVLLHLYR